jgi:hypothetical protein
MIGVPSLLNDAQLTKIVAANQKRLPMSQILEGG